MIHKIEDLCHVIVDCEHRTSPIDETGEFFAVGTPAMRGNVIDYSQARRISRETFEAWTRRLRPRAGDLLFAREAPVGPVVRVPDSENIAPGQRTVLMRPDPDVVDSRFFYYLLSSPLQQERLKSKAAGSTVAHLNVADIRSFSLELPGLDDQHAISALLGALDDKIAANIKLAKVADLWVRAGIERLFLDSADMTTIADLVSARREQVSPASLVTDSRYVGLEHVPRRSMWLEEVGVAADVTSNKSRFERGDILFGKLRPYFHKVVSTPYRGVCSTDILVLTPKDPALGGFALGAIASDLVVAAATSASEGTRMPRTSWKDLAAVSLPWPELAAARKFSADVSGIRKSVESQLGENRILAETRDVLLPALMTGKLRVRDAEKVLEGVL